MSIIRSLSPLINITGNEGFSVSPPIKPQHNISIIAYYRGEYIKYIAYRRDLRQLQIRRTRMRRISLAIRRIDPPQSSRSSRAIRPDSRSLCSPAGMPIGVIWFESRGFTIGGTAGRETGRGAGRRKRRGKKDERRRGGGAGVATAEDVARGKNGSRLYWPTGTRYTGPAVHLGTR